MLNVDTAVPYLLEHGLIDAEWIVDGDLTVGCAARRNRNLRVEGPSGHGYLIKQAVDTSPARRLLLDNEVAFLEFCRGDASLAAAAKHLPTIMFCDRDHSVHAMKLIAGAKTLQSHYREHNAGAFPLTASRALGRALGTLHSALRLSRHGTSPRWAWLPSQLPGALQYQRPSPSALAILSTAGARALRILHEHTELEDRLGRLRSLWQADSVIHGDIKFDNILVRSAGKDPDAGLVNVWIVDWESARVGDPAWDVAGALNDYLIFWTASMPISPTLTAEEMVDQARYPLEILRGAIRAFWEGYQRGVELDGADADRVLRRAVLYSAARLVQTAYELSASEDEIPAQAVILLQLSANLLAQPEIGQVHLYGIPPATEP
jgi:Ser/Thr protein kinase RdoA (MazF antagonist)